MTRVRWIRHHPLLGYFVLTYGISRGGIFLWLGAAGSFEHRPKHAAAQTSLGIGRSL